MADQNHYDDAADGLEQAAKALRACADDYDEDDTPAEKQPRNLRDAGREARRRIREARNTRD